MKSVTEPHCRLATLTARAALAVVLAAGTLNAQDLPREKGGQGSAVKTYREPEDPAVHVLAAAYSRINSDFPKDYTAEASERGLRDLDTAIKARPDDPRLHWFRYLTLDRMKRNAEARAAREEAIRLARICPGGDELLLEYYHGHANACVKEGDPAAGAAAYLAALELGLEHVEEYHSIAIYFDGLPKDRDATGPGPLFPNQKRLEELWGPLVEFFGRHKGPTDAQQLERVAQRVKLGMDYREVARAVGFPTFTTGVCFWDHGIAVTDACWRYEVLRPLIVREGQRIGAVPAGPHKIVHVVFVDKVVRRIDVTGGDAPESIEHKHGERASFSVKGEILAGVAFSRDGATIAAGDTSGVVHLFDVRAGREQSRLMIPGERNAERSIGWLRPIVFAPDGKSVAAGGLYDGTVRVWEVSPAHMRRTIQVLPLPRPKGSMDCVEWVAFSTDGQTLATAGYDRDLRLWDVGTGELRASLRGHSYRLSAVAFTPDGKTLATGDEGGTVRLWDLASGKPQTRWPGYSPSVVALAFSPDGKTLAVARERSSGADSGVGR